MPKNQLSSKCRLMHQAESAGQSPEVFLCRMLNQHDTQQEAAKAIGVTQGAIGNYLAHLPITRLTSYKVDGDSNSPKVHHQWVAMWPESLIGAMGA